MINCLLYLNLHYIPHLSLGMSSVAADSRGQHPTGRAAPDSQGLHPTVTAGTRQSGPLAPVALVERSVYLHRVALCFGGRAGEFSCGRLDTIDPVVSTASLFSDFR